MNDESIHGVPGWPSGSAGEDIAVACIRLISNNRNSRLRIPCPHLSFVGVPQEEDSQATGTSPGGWMHGDKLEQIAEIIQRTNAETSNWPPAGTSTGQSCHEHGTIYTILSDFGDCMTMQSMRLTSLLSEFF